MKRNPFSNLAIISGIVLIFTFLLQVQAQTPSNCDTTQFGQFCENPHTNPMNGYLPIDSVVYFRDPSLVDTDSNHTDIGIITAYIWYVPTQSYEYLVLTNPIDPQADLPLMRRQLVFRQGFGGANYPEVFYGQQ